MNRTGYIIASVCLAYPAAFGLAWIVTGWLPQPTPQWQRGDA